MCRFQSFLASKMEAFVTFQQAAGRWNGTYEQNLRLFDSHCMRMFPGEAALTEKMVASWCAKRRTESNNSCRVRVYAVSNFINYLAARGLTEVPGPDIPKMERSTYIPHAFTEQELCMFFRACDNLPDKPNSLTVKTRRLVVPAFFRLLYSSGIRTNEARLLRTDDADLEEGVLNIRTSKGHAQRYVALHITMTELLRKYDASIKAIHPGRALLFPSPKSTHLSNSWVVYNFNHLWGKVSQACATAYELRHNYAVENINQWAGDRFESFSNMVYLSKSMGHAALDSTKGYFHITPAMSDVLRELTGGTFDNIVPEVRNEKSYW